MNTAHSHQGKNVKRLREMLGIKPDALAVNLGLTPEMLAQLEQSEVLDERMLRRIAEVLRLPREAFEHIREESGFTIINSTFKDTAIGNSNNTDCAFNINSLEKLMQALEENKKLYERLLESEREKVEMLKALLGKQQGFLPGP